MYHVLIFQQQGGKYVLDSATNDTAESESGDQSVQFTSLDELVLFLTGHNLKVGEEDVQLTETCPCLDDSFRISSNSESSSSASVASSNTSSYKDTSLPCTLSHYLCSRQQSQ